MVYDPVADDDPHRLMDAPVSRATLSARNSSLLEDGGGAARDTMIRVLGATT